MPELLNLSAVILTRNEEAVIERCINSVLFAKEIIVIDSGSSDSTCDKARRLGARVVFQDWLGDFSRQRNAADGHAQCQWILHLDADETITPELATEIEQFFAGGNHEKFAAARFARKELIFGKWIENGGWYPQYKLRLYRKGACAWVGKVHENLQVNGEIHTFEAPILHDSYRDIHTFIEKFNRYSTLDAEAAFSEGKRFSCGKLFFLPLERFFGRYLIKKGYRDGFHGFVLAALIGFNYFMRYLKLWEKEFCVESKQGSNKVPK